MFQDKLALFDDKTAVNSGVTFTVGTQLCASSYDTGAAGSPNAGVNYAAALGIGGPLLHDIGRGRRMKLFVQVDVACTGATNTTQVQWICADDQGLTTNLTVLLSTAAIAVASLVAGYRFRFGTTSGVVPRRFVGVQYVIGTANLTAGTFTSGLQLDVDEHADILG